MLSAQETNSRLDTALLNVSKQLRMFPQEKIYLHTDKPYYITGENIFFRAHLIDALTHMPASVSRYVYVELIDPLDSAVIRLKVKPEDKMYFGHISLKEDMPEGVYKLRAYTNFMRNLGEDYFFSKTIRIGDPHSINIKTETNFKFEGEKQVMMELRFADMKMDEYLRPKNITVKINNKIMELTPDKNGLFKVKFNLSHQSKERVMYIELKERRTYKQYIRIPYPEDKYDVSFYPEGGYLIANSLCNIAFKSLKSNGLHENITGEIYDSKDEQIAVISSVFQGMGNFIITPQEGEKYYALCKNEKGVEMRFDLPEVRTDAYGLKLNTSKDRFWLHVNRPIKNDKDTLYLLIHNRGVVMYADVWDNAKKYLVFNKKNLSSGILHFILLSSDLQPLSERLAYVMNDDGAHISFETNKASYTKREKVLSVTEVKDAQSQSLSATFSISVTDDKEVKQDTCRNIMENFLLSSELKGYIECPACYFKGDKKSIMALDLLLMTHGWRRYNIPGVLKGNLVSPKEHLEIGQEISGIVKGGLLSKPSEKAKVTIFSPEKKYISMTETDKDGRFAFRGFEFSDSTKYVIHATSKRGRKRVELYVDKDNFPSHTSSWIYDVPKDDRTFMDYIHKADMKYSYENGMRLINLDEVVVKGSRREQEELSHQSAIYGQADNSLSEEDIEKSGATSIRDLLHRFPGVLIGPDLISIRGAMGNPMLIVDDMEMDIEMLDDINVNDVAKIDLLKSGATLATFGSRGANGVISIFSKTGKISFKEDLMNVNVHRPLGYHTPVEFYSPQYDTPEKLADQTPDLRTTIYWKPNVKIDKTTGEVQLDFYTADSETTYSVVIEGVSDTGKIIRHVGKIERK